MKKVFLLFMTASLMFVSCESESTTATSDKEGAKVSSEISDEFRALRERALEDITQRSTVFYSSERGGVFETNSSTQISIPADAIRAHNGERINGNIEIVYIEIFNKSKMAVTNKPTMGLVDGERRLLETGGEFYLDITYEGQQVDIVSPIKVNISTSNSDAEPTGMVLWNGDINNNENLTWIPAFAEDLRFENTGAVYEGGKNEFYDVVLTRSRNFGWCNIDVFVDFEGPLSFITVEPPAGFDDHNSSVYLAVEGQNNMLAQFDIFNASTNTFEEHGGLVSEGLKCHIIFVSGQGGNFIYSIQSVTVGPSASYSISNSSLITTSNYTQLEAAIDALP
ncbi:hypothetical protein [Flavobacterium sp. NKUCC04_CG]|uniref:hypothetical protein n=1 Tax=Flavobacterium sp. NKUCC04_CG TaxID=2842121 RepID=UPI001C5B50DE|nr:hypothetical protein [Flavobacterium sp. NKUCC04_CG]MBW3519130.1 hypothetical protein [Flavobacterium sp. NKUCC04_CG]